MRSLLPDHRMPDAAATTPAHPAPFPVILTEVRIHYHAAGPGNATPIRSATLRNARITPRHLSVPSGSVTVRNGTPPSSRVIMDPDIRQDDGLREQRMNSGLYA